MVRSMRQLVKIVVNFLAIAVMLPFSLPVRILTPSTHPSELFTFFCHLFSILPGQLGVLLRRGFYFIVLKRCGFDAYIGFGTIFAMRGSKIAKGVYIGPYCTLGLADIGENVLLGTNVDLIGSPNLHSFEDLGKPIKKQGGEVQVVSIGNGSWLGNSTVILANVGSECVVGAGSVVTKECDDWGIYVGNPARKIRDRREAG